VDALSLDPRQRRAAELLASAYTQEQVAKRVGCSVRSIGRWLADNPEFQQAAQADTDTITDQTPVEVLRSLLSSDRDDIRMRAASRLHEIEAQQSAPEQRGATLYVQVHADGTDATVYEVPEVQYDLEPGAADRLVLHRMSAPLPPKPYTPHPDPTKWPPLSEDAQ
jgi:hypothetical protein